MATYRYWRLGMNRGAQTSPISAFELYNTTGGTDQTGSGVATAKGVIGGAAANAFDRSSSTYWYDSVSAGGDGLTWLQYDFGAPTSINQIIARNPTTAVASNDVLIWISASNDLVAWDAVGRAQIMTHATSSTATWDTTTQSSVLTPAHVFDHEVSTPWPPVVSGFSFHASQANPDTGPGFIAGEVDITGTPNTPAMRKVRAHVSANGLLARETWSDPVTGAYRFDGLAREPFYVVALDYQLNYNAVVKDNVVPT